MVYFVTYSRLPDGDALAVRNVNIARTFVECGHKVTLIGMGTTGCLEHDMRFLSLRLTLSNNFIVKLRNYFGFKKRLQKFLKDANDIEAFVVNSLPINALNYIKRVSRRKGAKLFVDCCEWYSPEQFMGGILNINYIKNMYFVQKYIDTSTYPIAISKYLERYFKNKGCDTVRIPAILDISNMKYEKRTDPNKLIIVYAGSPGKKDYLDIVIRGVALLDQEDLSKLELRIVGVTKEQLLVNCEVDEKIVEMLGKSLKIVGRITRNEVLRNLEESDFTVLMRSPVQRYAKAGFPTKIVESLASATPVICNLTSDLKDYICEGSNGIIVSDFNSEAVSVAVRKGLNLTFKQRKYMYENARNSAEEFFDYRLYAESINKLIKLPC